MSSSATPSSVGGSEVERVDEHELRTAVAIANVPALLMFVFQFTGDERWLEDPYRPTRGKGLGDHDSGGLPDDIQEEIREAAVDAIMRMQAGEEPAILSPSDELTTRMVSICMGETVSDDYGPMLSSEVARRINPDLPELRLPRVNAPEGYKVLVIGTGVAGLAAAHQLEDMGVEYTILEKQPEPGGNWYQTTYPGRGWTPRATCTPSRSPRTTGAGTSSSETNCSATSRAS